MPADLKTSDGFTRISLVLSDDAMVVLEHEMRSDRMRRVLYDRVDAIYVWRKIPLLLVLLATLVLALPSMVLLIVTKEPVAQGMGMFLLLLLAVVVGPLIYCKRTMIRIVEDGKPRDYSTISRPRRVERFVSKLIQNVGRAKESSKARAAQLAPSPAVPPATATPEQIPTTPIDDALFDEAFPPSEEPPVR